MHTKSGIFVNIILIYLNNTEWMLAKTYNLYKLEIFFMFKRKNKCNSMDLKLGAADGSGAKFYGSQIV